jgi:hypothetical protein
VPLGTTGRPESSRADTPPALPTSLLPELGLRGLTGSSWMLDRHVGGRIECLCGATKRVEIFERHMHLTPIAPGMKFSM